MKQLNPRHTFSLSAIGALAVAFVAWGQNSPWSTEDVIWYAGDKPGALDVLVVAPASGQGDADALADRMGADVTAWPLEQVDALAGPKLKLPRVDVLVIANAGDPPPESVQTLLARQLDAGRGAVWVQYTGDAAPDAGVIASMTERPNTSVSRGLVPGASGMAIPDVTLLEGNKSKLVVIAYGTPAPLAHCLVGRPSEDVDVYWGGYDSALAMPARALLWAAGMFPGPAIDSVVVTGRTDPDPADIPPGIEPMQIELIESLGGTPLLEQFVLTFSEPLDRYYEVTGLIRQLELGTSSSYRLTLNRGPRSFPMQIPVGYHDYVADFFLSDKGVTRSWYSLTGKKSGWPYFETVTFSTTRVAINDSITVTAQIPPHPVKPEAGRMWVRAQDSYGRVVALSNRDFGAEAGEVSVRADVTGLFAPGLLVDSYAGAGSRPSLTAGGASRSAATVREMTVNVPFTTAFVVAARTIPSNEWGMRRHYESLRASGVHAVTTTDRDIRFEKARAAAGLFSWTHPEGRELTPIDFSDASPEEVSFGIWRAVLAQAEGVDIFGLERPGLEWWVAEIGADSVRGAFVDTVRAVQRGVDTLISEAELISRGVAAGDENEIYPEEFTPKKGTFRGEWFMYQAGECLVFALLGGVDSEIARLQFADFGSSSYLPITAERFGAGQSMRVAVAPGEVSIVTVVPYDVSRIIVQAPYTAKAGTSVDFDVEVKTRDELPGPHVFHLTLTPERGEPIAWYSRTVAGERGSARVTLPLALNDAPGVYTVTATDVLTGLQGETQFSVVP